MLTVKTQQALETLWQDLTEAEWHTLVMLSRSYGSVEMLKDTLEDEMIGDYASLICICEECEFDGSAWGIIPLIGGRLLDKWNKTKEVLVF